MAKTKRMSSQSRTEDRVRPALTPESRENQLIALSVDLAEKQLREGTASSQVITHFLKLGSTKNQLELEKIRHENALLEARTQSLQSAKRIEELYENALNAMRDYSGHGGQDD